MPRVVHFEIHAEDPQQAIAFYQPLFDWEFNRWGGMDYWLIKTGDAGAPGIDGGLLPRRAKIDGEAVIAYVCTVDVPSVDECVEKIVTGGGTIVMPKIADPRRGMARLWQGHRGQYFRHYAKRPDRKHAVGSHSVI